ncbi:hypothetical protein ACLE5P_28055 [Klebsiella pneumoniae]|uniref:hypothetical protein n=1 Tax=Klebsiella pneumoniae TaxID=573 RepID=UPI003AAEDCCC
MAVFSVGSVRSRRNVSSPIARAKAVTPPGPPSWAINLFMAVLSLYCNAAALSSASVIVPLTCFSAIAFSYDIGRLDLDRLIKQLLLRFAFAQAPPRPP